ncbi:hypothetical protein F443_22686 [Phytophthora nicotianae P1569]|uniref:Uncharacterized protein n=1 Tax=Phytophthora nicotianae P1569 TaxID=1317065 RepID=V9DU62_PHYNI|nr:hypothetical protein F443_22686 [Phytophthora nicotianae P1569]
MSRQDETRPRPHFSSSPLEEREPPKSTGTQGEALSNPTVIGVPPPLVGKYWAPLCDL